VPDKGIFDLLDAYAKLEGELRRDVAWCLPAMALPDRNWSNGRNAFARDGLFSRIRAARRLAGLYALAEALVLPTHSDTWVWCERSDGVRASDHREQCADARTIWSRMDGTVMLCLPKTRETERGDRLIGAAT